ncbi:MAG: protein kinase family protein [Pseudomonadota bacterium]|nr:protein kinase family protein [Pseudomonadota bacterium]
MALQGDPARALTPLAEASEEAAADAQAAARLREFLGHYRPAAPEPKTDLLQDRYRIDLSMPLPEFNRPFAQAFTASDMSDSNRQLIAHVCAPGSIQRPRVINALRNISHANILSMVAAGPVTLSRSEDERFVVFHERPAGKTLAEYLAANKARINQQFLCDRIIAPLASAIQQFSELDIAHGSINPENVYFTDVAILGPCVLEPCGYAQAFYYEPLERLQALPSAKGEGSTAQDYYALAALLLYGLFGPEHFAKLDRESLIRLILKEGVYNAMTRQKEMPEMFYDFFRGMLCQKTSDRWDYRYVKQWLDGKRYNVLPPPTPAEAIRPFEFGGQQANTRRELAHFLYTDWDKMAEPLQNGKLTQWVAVSLRNKTLAEQVTRLSRSVAEMSAKHDIQLAEQLMHALALLDPDGPIRIKRLSLFPDGIDSLCADLYASKSQQDLQLLMRFIEFNMVNYWMEMQRRGGEYAVPASINTALTRLERLRTCLRNSGYGFGLERMLYELNPDLPCLSPALQSWHVTTLPAMLKRLDQLAPQLPKEDEPLDRHIAAFIASKLGLQHDIRLHDLAAIPQMASSRAVLALYLLTQAQQKTADLVLPGLTHWLALRILPALEHVHSRTLRHKIKSVLMERARTGRLQLLAELVIDAEYASADQAGFQQAWTIYQVNQARIQSYRKGTLIAHESGRLGVMMAKAFAYLGLLVSLFSAFKP